MAKRRLRPSAQAVEDAHAEHEHAEQAARRKARRDRCGRAVLGLLRAVWSGRRYLGVVYAAALLFLASLLLAGASFLAASLVFAAGPMLGLVALGVGGARSVDGSKRFDPRWTNFRRWFLAIGSVFAGVWLSAVTLFGPGAHAAAVLGIATAAGSVAWCIKGRHVAEPEPAVDPAVELDQRILQFEASAPGYLPENTKFHSIDVVKLDDDSEAGFSGVLQLPIGSRQTYENLAAVRPNLAATWRVPADAVMLEPTDDQLPDKAKVTVLTRRNPSQEINDFDESWIVLKDGCFPYGVYPDGQRSWFRLYEPLSGPVHSVISGNTRTGKSSTVSMIITQSCNTGLVVPFVGDPQGGQSMPEWAGPQGRADWIAWNEEEIWIQTEAIMNLMTSRNERITNWEWLDSDGITRQGYSFFDPDLLPELPIVSWTLDEAHKMLANDAKFADLMTAIVKMASKCGVQVNIVTHHPAAYPDLGGSTGLKASLAEGNVICHRNGAASIRGLVLPEFMPSPRDIRAITPQGKHTKGTTVSYCPAPLGDRAAFQRTVRRENPFKWADAAIKRCKRPLTPEDRGSMGDAYAKRWERWANRGKKPVVIDMASHDNRAAAAAEPVSQRAADRILAYLAEPDAIGRTGVIATHLDLPIGTVGSALDSLAEQGKVVKVRRGEWALAVKEEVPA